MNPSRSGIPTLPSASTARGDRWNSAPLSGIGRYNPYLPSSRLVTRSPVDLRLATESPTHPAAAGNMPVLGTDKMRCGRIGSGIQST
jgi:hypothetical protein